MLNRKFYATVLCLGAGLFSGMQRADAAVTVTGTLSNGIYLVTNRQVATTAASPLKMVFSNTGGSGSTASSLLLCAGTAAQYSAGTCAMILADTTAAGQSKNLVIIDATNLNSLLIYVVSSPLGKTGSFSLTIE